MVLHWKSPSIALVTSSLSGRLQLVSKYSQYTENQKMANIPVHHKSCII